MKHFRTDNTDGYTQSQLDELNNIAEERITDSMNDSELKNELDQILREYDSELSSRLQTYYVTADTYRAITDDYEYQDRESVQAVSMMHAIELAIGNVSSSVGYDVEYRYTIHNDDRADVEILDDDIDYNLIIRTEDEL